jgi:hypothetical protein
MRVDHSAASFSSAVLMNSTKRRIICLLVSVVIVISPFLEIATWLDPAEYRNIEIC